MDWGAAAVRPSAWKKCLSLLLAFGFSNSLSAAAATGSQSVGNGPDVIELFTSEGCSSCPLADSLLSQLAASRKGSILALSEHVDYWDYLGWKDPNSSALFTARQQAYARRMRLSSTYTPQVIVNGILETIGNRRDAVEGALKTAEKPKLIKVTCRISSDSRTLTIEAKSTTPIANDLLANFAVTTDGVLSKVTRGENSGRELRHDNVVRRMATKRVGSDLQSELQLASGKYRPQRFTSGGFLARIRSGKSSGVRLVLAGRTFAMKRLSRSDFIF